MSDSENEEKQNKKATKRCKKQLAVRISYITCKTLWTLFTNIGKISEESFEPTLLSWKVQQNKLLPQKVQAKSQGLASFSTVLLRKRSKSVHQIPILLV